MKKHHHNNKKKKETTPTKDIEDKTFEEVTEIEADHVPADDVCELLEEVREIEAETPRVAVADDLSTGLP